MKLGLGKVKYNSNIAVTKDNSDWQITDCELYLSERFLRQKASGTWPYQVLEQALQDHPQGLESYQIVENRDISRTLDYEMALDRGYPFFDFLSKKNIQNFSQKFNPNIEFISHHYAHALGAEMMAPFAKALIVVLDGSGNQIKDIKGLEGEKELALKENDGLSYESLSVYLLDRSKDQTLTPVLKKTHQYRQGIKQQKWSLSEGLGMFYERMAEFIFNSNQAAGKVMGLAPFGQARPLTISRFDYLDSLPFELKFEGRTKKEWQGVERYQDFAAQAQLEFEREVLGLMQFLKTSFPHIDHLVMTGGCALNCTTNNKIRESKLFEQIYIPPFPGDGGISLGCVYHALKKSPHFVSATLPYEKQQGFLGPRSSTIYEIEQIFKDFHINKASDFYSKVASLLKRGEVIAWFTGRSESGPRALGHRSLLAWVGRKGLKNYLNEYIKMREDFRPYGCSVLHESAHRYFDIPQGFETPFMSFALKTRTEYKDLLNEVTHIDQTSRIQTVRRETNPQFHELLQNVEDICGHPIVLNTSLNIMGEPIVETIEDLKNFFINSQVNTIAIDGYIISKKSIESMLP